MGNKNSGLFSKMSAGGDCTTEGELSGSLRTSSMEVLNYSNDEDVIVLGDSKKRDWEGAVGSEKEVSCLTTPSTINKRRSPPSAWGEIPSVVETGKHNVILIDDTVAGGSEKGYEKVDLRSQEAIDHSIAVALQKEEEEKKDSEKKAKTRVTQHDRSIAKDLQEREKKERKKRQDEELDKRRDKDTKKDTKSAATRIPSDLSSFRITNKWAPSQAAFSFAGVPSIIHRPVAHQPARTPPTKAEKFTLTEVKPGEKQHGIIMRKLGKNSASAGHPPVIWKIRQKTLAALHETMINQFGKREDLFHGTGEDAWEAICRRGFDRSYGGKNGTALGRGTYFARDPTTSMAFVQGNNGVLFYCSCVIGHKVVQGFNDMGPPTDGSITSVDNPANPSIFVLFKDYQAMPLFAIDFVKGRRLDACLNR